MRRTQRMRALGGLGLAGALLLAGCGADNDASTASDAAPEASASPVDNGYATDGEVVTAEEVPAASDAPAASAGPSAADAPADSISAEIITATGETSNPSPVDPVQQETGLKAGSVDDNDQWNEYLDFLQTTSGRGRPYEVAGRRVISVRDGNGQPVLGAEVTLLDAQGGVLDSARTVADGRALLFAPAPADQESFQVSVVTAQTGIVVPLADAVSQLIELPEASQDGQQSVALDVLFLVDSTGSMGDEIDQLRQNMITIAQSVDQLPGQPDVRFGLTTYRDRDDAYVTRSVDFTSDVQAFTLELDSLQADGGGDKPEDLEAGLSEALRLPSWRTGARIGLVILVADAEPHIDYEQSVEYTTSMDEARKAGIKILPIASSGLTEDGEFVFRQMAQATLGRFVFLTYGADGASPGTGTGMSVDQYSVLPLDELVVRLISDEVAARGN
jgi:von Willebrand factor type A domain